MLRNVDAAPRPIDIEYRQASPHAGASDEAGRNGAYHAGCVGSVENRKQLLVGVGVINTGYSYVIRG